MNVIEAAERLGVHPETVRRMCIQGKLPHKRRRLDGRRSIVIDEKELESFDEGLTVKEVARRLAISKTAVYNLCSTGKIAHERAGQGRGSIRFHATDVDAYAKQLEGMLTAPEAAERLGTHRMAIYWLCQTGRLPHQRIGKGKGRLRIAVADADSYLERRNATANEVRWDDGGPRVKRLRSFKARNARRADLIRKSHREGLDAKEVKEFERLQKWCLEWVNKRHPRDTAALDERMKKLDELTAELRAKMPEGETR